MKQEIPRIEILKTHVLTYESYVDLVKINGVLKTQVFKKVSSTKNTFELDKEFIGDNMQKVVGENDVNDEGTA